MPERGELQFLLIFFPNLDIAFLQFGPCVSWLYLLITTRTGFDELIFIFVFFFLEFICEMMDHDSKKVPPREEGPIIATIRGDTLLGFHLRAVAQSPSQKDNQKLKDVWVFAVS